MPATIFNGDAVKPLKNKIRFKDEASEIHSGSFDAANNQSSSTNVTGLSLANADFRSAKILISVYIDATADLHEVFTLDLIQTASGWDYSQSSLGDESNVDFSVNSSGQVQYTSGNESGYSSSVFKWNLQATAI
jgi:hypothetical protein